MTAAVVPGDVVHTNNEHGFAIFTSPWDKEPGPMGGQMVGRLKYNGVMLVIARINHPIVDYRELQRDYLYVWAIHGHVDGSRIGWIPLDHVSKMTEFDALKP